MCVIPLANTFDTLKDAGFEEDILIEFPIDETLSLREFEEEVEERFNFSLELCNKDNKPFMNKSQHLFQIACPVGDRENRTELSAGYLPGYADEQ